MFLTATSILSCFFILSLFFLPSLIFLGCHSRNMSKNELTYIHTETGTGMPEKMVKY